MSRRALVIGLTACLFVALGVAAFAQATPPALTPPPMVPTPSMTPFVIATTMAGNFADSLLTPLTSWFAGIMDTSTHIGHVIFSLLAGISLIMSAIRLASGSLEDGVTGVFRKFLSITLLLMLIDDTFVFPNGSPGWFPLLLGMFSAIGTQLGGTQMAQLSTIPCSGPAATCATVAWSLSITPGGIIDEGVAFASQIWNSVLASLWSNLFVALIPGYGGMLLMGLVVIITLITSVGVILTMAFVAARFFSTLVKVYILGSQAFLLGFLGLEATAAMGTGLIALVFNVGIELAVLQVIIGIFEPMVQTFAVKIVTTPWFTVAGVAVPFNPLAVVNTIGQLLALDVGIALWVYLVKSVPAIAQGAVSGSWVLDFQRAASSVAGSSVVGRFASGSGLSKGAAGAVTAIAGNRFSSGGGQGGAGGSPGIGDRIKGGAEGALRGLVVGGPEGALAGAVAGAATARPSASQMAGSSQEEPGDEGTVKGAGDQSASPQGDPAVEAMRDALRPEGGGTAGEAGAPQADPGAGGTAKAGVRFTDVGATTTGGAPDGGGDVMRSRTVHDQWNAEGESEADVSTGSAGSAADDVRSRRARVEASPAQETGAGSTGGAGSANGRGGSGGDGVPSAGGDRANGGSAGAAGDASGSAGGSVGGDGGSSGAGDRGKGGGFAGQPLGDLLMRRAMYGGNRGTGISNMDGFDQQGPQVSIQVPSW